MAPGILRVIVAVFVVYVGIALVTTLCADDDKQRQVCHEVLRDLLDLFQRRRLK